MHTQTNKLKKSNLILAQVCTCMNTQYILIHRFPQHTTANLPVCPHALLSVLSCTTGLVSREKFIRLQHENKMLRLQQEGSENERIAELQQQLETAHRERSEQETETRYSQS